MRCLDTASDNVLRSHLTLVIQGHVSQQVLGLYASSFEFRGEHVVDALYKFCDGLVLPGSYARLSRIISAFADRYVVVNEAGLGGAHLIFNLSFYCVLLQVRLRRIRLLL